MELNLKTMSPDGLALLLLYAVAAARGCVSSRDGSGVDDDSSRRRIIRHSSDSGSDSNGGNSLGCGGIPGECRGGRRLSVSSSSVMTSHFDCLVECQRTAGCTHYTYFGGGGGGGADEEEEGVCLTFDGCPEVDQSSCSTDGAGFGGGGGCVSGDRDCVEEQCFFLGEKSSGGGEDIRGLRLSIRFNGQQLLRQTLWGE